MGVYAIRCNRLAVSYDWAPDGPVLLQWNPLLGVYYDFCRNGFFLGFFWSFSYFLPYLGALILMAMLTMRFDLAWIRDSVRLLAISPQ